MNQRAMSAMSLATYFILGLAGWCVISTLLFASRNPVQPAIDTPVVVLAAIDSLLACMGLAITIWKTANAAERYLWASFTLSYIASLVIHTASPSSLAVSILFGINGAMIGSLITSFVKQHSSATQKKTP